MSDFKTGHRSSTSFARLLAAGTFWGGLMFSGVMLAAVIFLSS